MEQAFILPLPRFSGPHPSEKNIEDEAEHNSQVILWRSILDKLRDQKISWEQFLTYLPDSPSGIKAHPAARLGADRNGQTLLHIAVSHDRYDMVELLGSDLQLRSRRDAFGLTALEHAQFLHRLSSIKALGRYTLLEFTSQPNVTIKGGKERLDPLNYLPYPIFENGKILDETLEKTYKAKLEDEILPEKIWMGIYFDKEIQTGLNPRISIRWIDDEVGFGVFAEQRIPSCAFVGEYTGIIKEARKRQLKEKRYCVRYTTWQMGRRNFVIDAETHGNYTRFINHSTRPNIGLQSVYWRGLPRMVFISLKEIPEGSQLTFDYGPSFWKEMDQIPKVLS